jgi:hypothetical protein
MDTEHLKDVNFVVRDKDGNVVYAGNSWIAAQEARSMVAHGVNDPGGMAPVGVKRP